MMNKILLLLVFFVTLTGCRKEYNSDLRGRWQMRTEIKNNVENKVDTIFYSFDNRVLDIQKKQNQYSYSQQFAQFTQQGDSLFFDYVDAAIPYTEHYQIVTLNSSTLQLRNDSHQLIFRKF